MGVIFCAATSQTSASSSGTRRRARSTSSRKPSNFANGNTRDRQGRLITCEHGGRRVVRTEYDGSIAVLIDSFEGKRLNSPNDIVVKSDGSIWFTDPVFGLLGNYEGYKAEPEIDANVYRIDGATGNATIVAEGVLGPNGLCFSPDEKILYVVDSRGVPNRKILAYDVSPDGTRLSNKRVLIDAGPGTPDGIRCDIDGNLWCGWGMGDPMLDGVMVFAPDGAPIGRIALPERCANICFGGKNATVCSWPRASRSTHFMSIRRAHWADSTVAILPPREISQGACARLF